jgi:hypothetical protein
MADSKGNDGKSGAVKPPVLDLTARETGADKPKPAAETSGGTEQQGPTRPDAKPTAKPESTAKPALPPRQGDIPPQPTQAGRRPGFGWGAMLGGAVLGLAGAYGLATAGLWPTPPAPAATPDPRVAQVAAAIPELETVTSTTQSELAALNGRVAALEEGSVAAPTPEPEAGSQPAAVELTALETDLAALTQRVETLAQAEPQGPEPAELASELSALAARIDEVAARLGTAEAGLRSLDTTVTATSAALAEQPTDIGAVLQLPLVLSGLETAFAGGRPYETELAALRAAVPDVAVPTSVANAAASGLPRADMVQQRFAEQLPAMAAGRPADPQASWQQGAGDWLATVLAVRPVGELEGDTPQAILSRLEGAVARRDWVAAGELLGQLPEPMQAAAGDVPEMIAAQAEAAGFLGDVRARALDGVAQ